MSKVSTVQIGGRMIDLYAFTGKVVHQDTAYHTTATVHANNQVTTQTDSYSQLFVRANSGEERDLNIPNMKIGVRPDNTVSLLWGIKSGKEKGDYIAVYNHDTKSIHHIRKSNNDLAGPPGYNLLLILAAFLTVFGVFGLFSGSFSSIFYLLIGGGLIYWIYTKQRKLMSAVDLAARSLSPA